MKHHDSEPTPKHRAELAALAAVRDLSAHAANLDQFEPAG